MTPDDARAESIAVMRGILSALGLFLGGLLVLAVMSAEVWVPAVVGWVR